MRDIVMEGGGGGGTRCGVVGFIIPGAAVTAVGGVAAKEGTARTPVDPTGTGTAAGTWADAERRLVTWS